MNNKGPQLIDYTNKDYNSLREAMLEIAREKLPAWTDHSPNDLGVVLLELFAYMGDMLFYYQDRIANESYLDSAVERRSVVNLLRLIGYELRPPQAATVDLTLLFEDHRQGTAEIPSGSLFRTKAEATGVPITFRYVRASLVKSLDELDIRSHNGKGYRVLSLPVVQVDDLIAREVIGSSDGAPSQRFALGHGPLIDDSLEITVTEDGQERRWQRRPSLLHSLSNDTHYRVYRDEEDVAWIEFGDDKYSSIPSRGRDNIAASYRVGGGVKGNVPPNTIIEAVTKIDKLEAVFNEEAAAGGTEAEDAAEAALRGPHLFRTMGRAVTATDYEAHAREFGVGKARARSASWNRIELYVAPVGGGYPSDTLKEDLRVYFEDKRVMTTLVDILDPRYVSICLKGSLETEPYFYEEQVQQQVGNAVAGLLAFDNVDFEDRLYLSKFYEAIEAVEGVAGVHISRLARMDAAAEAPALPENGVLALGWSEIPAVGPLTWQWNRDLNHWEWWTPC